MSAERDLSVIVLAFDEADNVPAVLDELIGWLREHEPRAEIVFVDDGSTDATLDVARAVLDRDSIAHALVRHDVNRGMGAGLKSGVRAARGEWITFLPADGQIAPAAIGTLRSALREPGVDLVFSVYDHRDDGLDRTILSAGVRGLIRAVHGVKMNSDGPYLIRRALFDPDDLLSDTFFLNFELPIRALAAGVVARTVTIACRPRRSGSSKSKNLRRVIGVARELIALRRRRNRRALSLLVGSRQSSD